MSKTIHIAGAAGYWGESAMATPQLLSAHKSGDIALDYIVYDYLAEITMSILARAKAKNPAEGGYAADFVTSVIGPHLSEIAETGVKLISNAGGLNPEACGRAIRALISGAGLDLKVAVITGDDQMERQGEIIAAAPKDMFSGAPVPALDKIASINSYLGAFPIAKALAAGADIIVTGRVVDSAVTLGACIHEFGWGAEDWDLLASGSLCGHILECGPQATGGNFTDWELAGEISEIGYPIAEIQADGRFITTKPPNTGGLVSVGTISEQMLYEIGDPQSYLLPDVTCDFSNVEITQIAPNRVEVSPAQGRAAPQSYKTSLIYADGFRAGTYLTFYGNRSAAKAKTFGDAVIARAEKSLRSSNLGVFSEVSQEIIGGKSSADGTAADVVLKIAVKHQAAAGVSLFLKELNGTFLATPPGLSFFTGAGRPKPSPVMRLFSYLTPKEELEVQIEIGEQTLRHKDMICPPAPDPAQPILPERVEGAVEVKVEDLAWARSGDKGDMCNIGLIARKPDNLPALWSALTPEFLGHVMGDLMEDTGEIERFYLPGSNAMNILLGRALGGGGTASLRNDAQGKGLAQRLLAQRINVPANIAKEVSA
jgi:hypothetical protein